MLWTGLPLGICTALLFSEGIYSGPIWLRAAVLALALIWFIPFPPFGLPRKIFGLVVMGVAGLPMAGLFKRGDRNEDSGHGSIQS